MLLLVILPPGCSSAPVADFLDWVSPSPVRPQGTGQPAAAAPATPAPNPIVLPPEATPPLPPPSGPPAVPPPAPVGRQGYESQEPPNPNRPAPPPLPE